MSRTKSSTRQSVHQQCRRLKTGWSAVERRRRHDVACRRQEVLWQLLRDRVLGERSVESPHSEVLAIGAPSLADLARFAG